MSKYPPEFICTGPLHKLYVTWYHMIRRCQQGSYVGRYDHRYFNRGIRVCEEWSYWPIFAKWATEHGWVEGLEIDRENNDLGYSPSNCRFVTDMVQTKNRDLARAYAGVKAGQTRRWAKKFICVETGEAFLTQIEAFRQKGVDRKSLRMALNGQLKQAGGFHWKYADQQEAA